MARRNRCRSDHRRQGLPGRRKFSPKMHTIAPYSVFVEAPARPEQLGGCCGLHDREWVDLFLHKCGLGDGAAEERHLKFLLRLKTARATAERGLDVPGSAASVTPSGAGACVHGSAQRCSEELPSGSTHWAFDHDSDPAAWVMPHDVCVMPSGRAISATVRLANPRVTSTPESGGQTHY